MRLPSQPPFPPGLERWKDIEIKAWSDRLGRYLLDFYRKVIEVINGGIVLGDGTDAVNLRGVWVTVADTGLADTEFTVTHGIGQIVKQFLHTIDKGGVVYKSDEVNWTTNILKLKCTVANANVRLFICAPS